MDGLIDAFQTLALLILSVALANAHERISELRRWIAERSERRD